jgi:hypothetical protein
VYEDLASTGLTLIVSGCDATKDSPRRKVPRLDLEASPDQPGSFDWRSCGDFKELLEATKLESLNVHYMERYFKELRCELTQFIIDEATRYLFGILSRFVKEGYRGSIPWRSLPISDPTERTQQDLLVSIYFQCLEVSPYPRSKYLQEYHEVLRQCLPVAPTAPVALTDPQLRDIKHELDHICKAETEHIDSMQKRCKAEHDLQTAKRLTLEAERERVREELGQLNLLAIQHALHPPPDWNPARWHPEFGRPAAAKNEELRKIEAGIEEVGRIQNVLTTIVQDNQESCRRTTRRARLISKLAREDLIDRPSRKRRRRGRGGRKRRRDHQDTNV